MLHSADVFCTIHSSWWRSLRDGLNASKLEPVLVGGCESKGTSFPTVQDGGRSHESDASAIHGCNGGFDQAEHGIAERAASEQTASSERACGTQTGSARCSTAWDAGDGSRCGHPFVVEDKRLLKGARRVARLEHSVQWVHWRSDTTSAEVHDMDDAAKAAAPIPNATIMDENDRAASIQPYWIELMIYKGATLNIVFQARDREGLEAWRQLTENYEPNTVRMATDVHPVLLIPR